MTPPDELPPQDLNAEEAALGAALLSPRALAEVIDLAPPGSFYRPAHGEILAAAAAVAGRGAIADAVTVAGELEQRGELHRIGGAPYLHTLISAVPTAANAAYYAERVADMAVRRRMLEAGTRLAQLARDRTTEPAELLARAQQTLDQLPHSARSSTGRQLRTTFASDVVPRRVRWIWDGRIVAGGLTLLAGREGLGKSTIAVDVTAQLTRGVLDGECKGEPRTVIYVHSEDARDFTIVPRLTAAGADLTRVVFLDAVTPHPQGDIESPLVLPLDDELLVDAIRDHRSALVVLDAATSVIDGRLDGDKDRQMRQGLERIAKIGEKTDAAMLGLVHFGKRDSADTGKLILGSIAWSQVARSVLAVARDDDTEQLVLSTTKTNLGPGAPSLAAQIISAVVPTPGGPDQRGPRRVARRDRPERSGSPRGPGARGSDRASDRGSLARGLPHRVGEDLLQGDQEGGAGSRHLRANTGPRTSVSRPRHEQRGVLVRARRGLPGAASAPGPPAPVRHRVWWDGSSRGRPARRAGTAAPARPRGCCAGSGSRPHCRASVRRRSGRRAGAAAPPRWHLRARRPSPRRCR
jgi:AAA domain-containing protein/DnaB helicase-like protein